MRDKEGPGERLARLEQLVERLPPLGRRQDAVERLGNCQQFLMRPNFPGGMGGEVGVYVRVPGSRPIPDSKVLPTWAGGIMNAVSKLGGHNLWWPDPDMQPEIEFTIINPIDSSILVRFGRQNTYWANRWMEPASFDRYKKDHHTPGWPTQYKMVFTINGVTRSWTPGLVSH